MKNEFRSICIAIALVAGSPLAMSQQAAPDARGEPAALRGPATTAADTAPSTAHAGVLKSVQGDVMVVAADDTSRRATSGATVSQSDRLVSGARSGAGLVLRDGTHLVVGPSSELQLKAFRFDATTEEGNVLVSLVKGSLRMISGLIGKKNPDAVNVETQTAIIGIRGTDFIVNAQPGS